MHGSKERLPGSCGLVQWLKSIFSENLQILPSLILLLTPPLKNTKRLLRIGGNKDGNWQFFKGILAKGF